MSLQENAKGQYSKPYYPPKESQAKLNFPAFARDHGSITHDTTCYHAGQASWGVHRANHAPIIFQDQRQDHKKPSYAPGNMRWDRKLVIDYWLEPVRAFEEFPLVLSSKYEAMLIEAAKRSNSQIALHDFRARM